MFLAILVTLGIALVAVYFYFKSTNVTTLASEEEPPRSHFDAQLDQYLRTQEPSNQNIEPVVSHAQPLQGQTWSPPGYVPFARPS